MTGLQPAAPRARHRRHRGDRGGRAGWLGQFVPYFATTTNLSKVLLEAAILAVAAFGMTLVLLNGPASTSPWVASCRGRRRGGLARQLRIAWPLAVLVGLLVGLLLGAVNGVIVSRLKLPPFIATFGHARHRGRLALYIANVIGHPVFPPDFVSLGQ